MAQRSPVLHAVEAVVSTMGSAGESQAEWAEHSRSAPVRRSPSGTLRNWRVTSTGGTQQRSGSAPARDHGRFEPLSKNRRAYGPYQVFAERDHQATPRR